MIWWMWVLLGVVLLVVEMVTPGGLFALFFGVSALLVAGMAALGLGPLAPVARLRGAGRSSWWASCGGASMRA